MFLDASTGLPPWSSVDLVAIGSAVATIFAAAALRGFTGFGFAIAAVPLLSLIMQPGEAVPLAIGLQLCGGMADVPRQRHHCHWPSLRWLIAGASVGSPIGVAALACLPPGIARLVISVACMLATAALALGVGLRTPPRGAATALVGLTAGVFNGLAAMPGPPAVAYYMASPLEPGTIRASLLVFFAATSAVAAASLFAAGLADGSLVWLAVGGFPAMTAGLWVGERLFLRAPGRAHRTVSLLLMAAIAAASGATAIQELAIGP